MKRNYKLGPVILVIGLGAVMILIWLASNLPDLTSLKVLQKNIYHSIPASVTNLLLQSGKEKT